MHPPDITPDLIARVPKSDLHVHLDGSLRLGTLIELARAQGVVLPSYTTDGLRELVFRDQYASLAEYLRGFACTVAVLREPEAIARVAFELAEDAIAEGVRYMEVRFAPHLHVSRSEDVAAVLGAVNDGMRRAAREQHARPAVAAGDDMPFAFGLICCAMRNFDAGMSEYYSRLIGVLAGTPQRDRVALASLETVRGAVDARDRLGLPIVGFDLAGEEAGYRAGHHVEAYQLAHRHFLRKTVHAGEAYGPESIYEAITACHAERIGHGTFLFAPERIVSPRIVDRAGYVEKLVDYIGFARITLEVCPTSNLQTTPELRSLADHPVRQMIERALAVAIGTDNRLVSNTTLCRELSLVATELQLDWPAFRRLVLAGFKGAFFPGRYGDKRAFVEQAARLLDRAARQPATGAA